MEKSLIVTCALPYANGSIHLGHLLEHIQGDIWVRWHKSCGRTCYFIGADDTHGTPVMLKAQELNLTPEAMIDKIYAEHVTDLKSFNIEYDEFYTTHSPESKTLVTSIFNTLYTQNKIYLKSIEQLYDNEAQMFLPDRFIKGQCPKCAAINQYGDNCEVCGATYAPTDLINPRSTISMTVPILKQSDHYFFKLSECADFLKDWLKTTNRLPIEAQNKLFEWLDAGLMDWDISRDKPYFGFTIPGHDDKYFYVWLDAPVGYMGSFEHYCSKNNLDFVALWNNSDIYHFIGKDILYFHALFWPAILHCAQYNTPTSIFIHGFVTVNGQKMSKSRGTFITARKYIDSGLSTDCYRYYIASKLTNKIEDVDFLIDEFVDKVNAELVGKFINIAARNAKFLDKIFMNQLSNTLSDVSLLNSIIAYKDMINTYYQDREYNKITKLVMTCADQINSYIDQEKPWILAKDVANQERLHQICSLSINMFRILSIYLKPIIPNLIIKIEDFLNIQPLLWSDIETTLTNHPIKSYTHIISRIDKQMADQLVTITNNNPTL